MTGYRGIKIKNKNNLTEEIKDEMWKMYNQGIPKYKIAEALNISRNTVYSTIRFY